LPWIENCAMKERLQLVSSFQTGSYTVAELAKEFRVCRKTAYKWLGRFAQECPAGLEERSRAPQGLLPAGNEARVTTK
jgi:transposase